MTATDITTDPTTVTYWTGTADGDGWIYLDADITTDQARDLVAAGTVTRILVADNTGATAEYATVDEALRAVA